ncbi:hypothetical protein [Burkholderia sp. Leaf177]|uniref:hypothetical protein n=1 Tax=Burkholderia sp. Leaf177 TaxID=1736287 RepID=UPI0012E399A0|nr:hypothetical protein [Burkholderia sp. Leaf177]
MSIEPLDYVDSSKMADVLHAVKDRQEKYLTAAARYRYATASYDVPLIVLAVGSVAAAIFTHGAARGNWLAGIGIGAGGLTLGSSLVNAQAKMDAYRVGATQTSCLYASALAFDPSDQTIINAVTRVEGKISIINTGIADASKQLEKVAPDALSEGEVVTVRNAESAIALAQHAIASGEIELSAYRRSGAVVWAALTQIDATVSQLSKETPITWNAAVSLITQYATVQALVPQTSPIPVAKSTSRNLNAEPIVELERLTLHLTEESKSLEAEKPFSIPTAKIAACTILSN